MVKNLKIPKERGDPENLKVENLYWVAEVPKLSEGCKAISNLGLNFAWSVVSFKMSR